MQIGFEAKRVFQNTTGLGNYARALVQAVAQSYPQHHLHLFAPHLSDLFDVRQLTNISAHHPQTFLHRTFSAYWRSKAVVNDIRKNKIEVFHGLSAELPIGIDRLAVKKIVTVHDLIFERYPDQYKKLDVKIYRNKTQYACKVADKIIAVSTQTKNDLVDLYGVAPEKIEVIPPICDLRFYVQGNEEQLKTVKTRYELPDQYILYVGSIIERKSLLQICKAMIKLPKALKLVVVGSGKNAYAHSVKQFIDANALHNRVLFLNETIAAASASFKNSDDLPAIYQQALTLVYPSLYEGFGMPITEALASGTPVITSDRSCMPETAAGAAILIDPEDVDAIVYAVKQLLNNHTLLTEMQQKSIFASAQFSSSTIAHKMFTHYLL